jgi:integrase
MEAPMQAQDKPLDASRQLVKTGTPGIYRRGGRYVVRYRDRQGKERKAFARTLAEARDVKARLRVTPARGEESRETFEEYARAWIESYGGRTSRGVRDSTRADYRRAIEQHAIPFLGRMRLRDIRPLDVKAYATHVADKGLSANTVRLAVAPVRALLATAVEDGDLSANPAAGLRLATARPAMEDDADRAKALSEEELRGLVAEAAPEWRLLVEFLGHTGLRISEALALRWGDVDLGRRRVRVRRRLYRGTVGPPKTTHGRRDVPLSPGMARALWNARKMRRAADGEPVFVDRDGGVLDRSAAFRAVRAAGRRAGVPWVGLHTLRHTCASILFRRGFNAKQVQAFLGHHSPAFTLATYVHLLDDDLPDPSFLDEITIPDQVASGREPDARTGAPSVVA